MSVVVDLADLPRVLEDFGTGYLLTVSTTPTVKAVSVAPRLVDGELHVSGPGRGSVANARAHAAVTLLFPPRTEGGLTLLVDGTAAADGEDLRIRPTGAVLHKAAS
jgi:hypothetical protein